MKRILTSIILMLVLLPLADAQVIKVSNGISLSSLHHNKKDMIDIFDDNVVNYSGLLGINYWEHTYFYLSSEVGFVRAGGDEKDLLYIRETADPNVEGREIKKENWNYIHLNTTFRVRYPFGSTHLYVGAGPKIDFLIGSTGLKNRIMLEEDWPDNEAKMKRAVFGAKLEVGIDEEYNQWVFGANASYLLPFNDSGKIYDVGHKSRTFLFMLTVGYRLN